MNRRRSTSFFLAPYDLEPIPHSNPQGIPLLIQPVQQVPIEPVVAGERVGSSSSSLKEQIDKFRFEGEASGGVQVIPSLNSEKEIDKQSDVHPPILITTLSEDSSEEEGMSDLKALLKTRGKKAEPKGTGTSRLVVNLPPPPSQVPDPSLKPILDLKKKRPLEPKEREVVMPPKTTKQQKVVRDNKSKRTSSVKSQEEPLVADECRGQRIWSLGLELDGVPFS